MARSERGSTRELGSERGEWFSPDLLSTEESQLASERDGTTSPLIRRAAMPVLALIVGLVAGGFAHSSTQEGRFRPPLQPIASAVEVLYSANMSALEGKTRAILSTGLQLAPDGYCGGAAGYQTAIKCAYPGICCLGSKGNICGGPNAFCALGDAGVIVCSPDSVGCVNDLGNSYCCAKGNVCASNVCEAAPGQCFPGEALVTVKGIGAVPLQKLRSGDNVLVKSGDYEPVLGFLHVTRPSEVGNFLTVKHSKGQLRVSPHHVVFVENGDKLAADLVAGDRLLVAEKSGVVPREVLSVMQSTGRSGMFAPMTPSGTVVVDNVVASNYASYAHIWFPHCAFHAVFFPVRSFHALGLASLLGSSSEEAPLEATETLHPYAAMIWRYVGPLATKIF